jgi:arsenite methyltransferase
MDTTKIKNRYTELANDSCCLSCGGAINFGKPKEGEVCVDLGSGRGNDVLKMAQDVGDNGFAYGIDVTPEMIKKANKTAKKLDITNVKFINSNLEKLPLESCIVDLVISNCTINHVKDKYAVWSEIYRILKPGGRFSVSDIYSSAPVPPEYANDPVAVSECWGGSVTKQVYLDTLKKAGFSTVEIAEESTPYDKGKITVTSFTIVGKKQSRCCCK